MANVKLIAQALRMYLADNDNTFPPNETRADALRYFSTYPGGGDARQWDPKGHQQYCHRARQANPYLRWPVLLDQYLPDRRVWRCPEAKIENGASFINSERDWLGHLQRHRGEWGRNTDPWLCPVTS